MKNYNNRYKIELIILGIIILLCSIALLIYVIFTPKPPKKEDLPLLDQEIEVFFLENDWESSNIKKICITGNIIWPKGQMFPPSYDQLSKILNYLGYEAQNGKTEDCDAILNLEVEGRGLSAMYSNSRSCATGYDFNAQILFTSDNLENLEYSVSEKKTPPETVSESQCETAYEGDLSNKWDTFLKSSIRSIWGENALMIIAQKKESGPSNFEGICTQGAFYKAKIEYLNLYIQKMMENEEYPSSLCIYSIKDLGPDAEIAIPYLLYLLDTSDTSRDSHANDNIFDTLRAITNEEIPNNKIQWWSWWEELQENK